MSDLGMDFDATTVAPNAGFGQPIPNGDYVLAMTASERKTTDSGWGLSCEFTVQDGEFKGRKVFTFLNLQNASAEAVKIAQGDLSAICHATGVLRTSNAQDFYNIPLLAHVKVTPKREDKKTGKQYDEGNKITSYKRIGGAVSAPTQASAKAPKAGAPSWASKKTG